MVLEANLITFLPKSYFFCANKLKHLVISKLKHNEHFCFTVMSVRQARIVCEMVIMEINKTI